MHTSRYRDYLMGFHPISQCTCQHPTMQPCPTAGPCHPKPAAGYLDIPMCILWFTKTLRWEVLSMCDVHLSLASLGTRQVSVYLGSQSPKPFPKAGARTHPLTEQPATTPPYKTWLLEKMVGLPAPTQPSQSTEPWNGTAGLLSLRGLYTLLLENYRIPLALDKFKSTSKGECRETVWQERKRLNERHSAMSQEARPQHT